MSHGFASRAPAPRVWVLTDDRPGNSTQSLGLAEALGWPYERKRLAPGFLSMLHNRLLGASCAGIRAPASDPLEPPWPDLVVAAGRRTAPVALWVRRASGGRTRLVHLGRKGGDHAALFDLVVTPTYCRLPPHPHRMQVSTPLHRLRPDVLKAARESWRARLCGLPAPRTALLMGGPSGQYRLPARVARSIGEALARRARDAGGSVLVSTGRRTPAAATRALLHALAGVPHAVPEASGADPHLGVQASGADPHLGVQASGADPHLGVLAWADALVITADSESSLAEAVSLGRPITIHPLPMRASFRLLRVPREAVVRASARRGAVGRLCRALLHRGLVRPPRDLALLHADLIRRGVACRFGEPEASPPSATAATAALAHAALATAALPDDTGDVVARVRALLGFPTGGSPREGRAPAGPAARARR